MRKLVLSLCCLASASFAAEARLVSLESLLDEMGRDRTRADGSFVSRLWSSYDRRSVRNDGEAEGWYANRDWSNWIRSEKIAGRTECVMVDAKGPGTVTRIWTANGENTVLRIYLDGASEPTWTGLATNLTFGLAKPIPFPLRNAISQDVDPRYRAYNLYLPIPYAKSIRITAELPKSDHRFWYNVETRTYDTAAEVESLSPAVLSRAQKAIALTAEKITRKSSGSGQAFRFDRDSLVAGAAAEIAIERENSAVCGIDLGLDRETMMSLRLRMAFDGEETVDCRAAQLLGERAFARLPMPFAKSCKVTLENLGANVIDLSKARVQVVKRAWSAEKDLHFGAYGFALTNIPTRVGKAGYHELPWLKLEGEGFLVGHALLLNNYADYGKAAWWGEGDEKIYVDGETFPSYFGTGTEDFFGYAWGPNKAYDAAPFLSMPVADGDLDAKGRHRAEMWRLRKLDVVPFKKSVKLDVELWHWQDTTMDYAPATFWYARPGARKKIQNAAPLPNVSSMWTVWNGRTVAWSQVRNEAYPFPFVEWVELMAATGGNPERDCLKDPADRTVLDDYDFAPLVEVCRGVLAMGVKPYLKLGGVPSKFTEDANGGSFKTNIRPPTDPLVHYRYMRACAAALRAAFGREVVRSWRFAVLTEADNFAWFKSADGDRGHTREAFFSLYDYTVRAFEEELGEGLVIGTHLLDPNDVKVQPFTAVDFARHCLCGTNAATGGIGAPLRLLTFSNYIEPGVNGVRGPNKFGKIAKALTEVRALGYTNLVTGIDEGRVIWGAKGSVKRDLHARAVGQSYQAAYDVRLAKTAYDLGFDYLATWGWFSGPEIWEGLPSHHYFTQREIAKFAGMNRLEIDRATDPGLDVVAAVSADGKRVRAMVGFLTDDLNATNRFEGAVRLHLPPSFASCRVTCRTLTLDDRNNWFCDWQTDRKRLGIKDDDFIWSPDSFAPLAGRGLKNPKHRSLFAEELQPRYAEKAKSIRPVESTVDVSSAAVLELPLVFRGNSAVFVTFERVGEAARPFTYAHWNIGHFAIGRSNKSAITSDKAEARLKEFRSWMDLGADWFGISEYAPNFTADGSVKTGTALFGDYDLQNVGPDGCFQWNAQFGKSSRFKVLESKTVFYKTRCQACYYLAQRVLIDGKTEAWIVQTHFDWKSWQINEAQFKELVEAFRDCPRVIVSGDFNWLIADCRRDQRHWNDQFRAYGYDLALDDLWVAPGTGGGSKTTHVFIDNIAVKGFEISEPGVIYDADRKMSDHFIVHCKLTPTKNAHTHVPGPWKVVKDPTATAPGERVRSCTVAGCRHAERRTMEALEYAWLETDGSTCIATDYVPDLEKTVVEITFRFLDLNPKEGHTLCWANAATEGRQDDSPSWGAIWWPGDGKPLLDCGSAPGEAVIGEGFTDTTDFHTLVFGGNRAVLDGKKAVGKEKPAKGKAGGPLALFTRWCVSTKSEESFDKNASKIRVKSIRIWEGDGASRKLVHHYVPAKNGCEATFYDTVEKRYLRTLGLTMPKLGGEKSR